MVTLLIVLIINVLSILLLLFVFKTNPLKMEDITITSNSIAVYSSIFSSKLLLRELLSIPIIIILFNIVLSRTKLIKLVFMELGVILPVMMESPFMYPIYLKRNYYMTDDTLVVKSIITLHDNCEVITDGVVECDEFEIFTSGPFEQNVLNLKYEDLNIYAGYLRPGVLEMRIRDCNFAFVRTGGFCLMYDRDGRYIGESEDVVFRFMRRLEKLSMIYAALMITEGSQPDDSKIKKLMKHVKNNDVIKGDGIKIIYMGDLLRDPFESCLNVIMFYFIIAAAFCMLDLAEAYATYKNLRVALNSMSGVRIFLLSIASSIMASFIIITDKIRPYKYKVITGESYKNLIHSCEDDVEHNDGRAT